MVLLSSKFFNFLQGTTFDISPFPEDTSDSRNEQLSKNPVDFKKNIFLKKLLFFSLRSIHSSGK